MFFFLLLLLSLPQFSWLSSSWSTTISSVFKVNQRNCAKRYEENNFGIGARWTDNKWTNYFSSGAFKKRKEKQRGRERESIETKQSKIHKNIKQAVCVFASQLKHTESSSSKRTSQRSIRIHSMSRPPGIIVNQFIQHWQLNAVNLKFDFFYERA